jgi:hypothetical protein
MSAKSPDGTILKIVPVVDETESGRRPVQVPISGLNQGTIGKEPWGPSN